MDRYKYTELNSTTALPVRAFYSCIQKFISTLYKECHLHTMRKRRRRVAALVVDTVGHVLGRIVGPIRRKNVGPIRRKNVGHVLRKSVAHIQENQIHVIMTHRAVVHRAIVHHVIAKNLFKIVKK